MKASPVRKTHLKVKGGAAMGVNSGVHKRCTWLNANVFTKGAIDEEAITMLSTLPWERAMEICKDMEEKSARISNPSGYIKVAVKREMGLAPGGGGGYSAPGLQSVRYAQAYSATYSSGPQGGYGGQEAYSKVHKRCTWLNANVFQWAAIDDNAIAALATLEVARAMELCKDVEEKAAQISNPSNYIMAAVKRESGGGKGGYGQSHGHAYNQSHGQSYSQSYAASYSAAPALGHGQGGDFSKCHKRVTWLNANVFNGAIDQEAIEALASIDVRRAMEMCKDLEEKGAAVSNPSGYIKASVRRELGLAVGGKGGHSSSHGPPGYGSGHGHSSAEHGNGSEGYSKVHKRCTWLSANVFWPGAIDEEAIAALASLEPFRAMEMCKDLEEKGQQVANPSGYLKAAVKREFEGPGAKGKGKGKGQAGKQWVAIRA